jgi:hypothetical protein
MGTPKGPSKWPSSISELRKHTNYDKQGMEYLGDGDGYLGYMMSKKSTSEKKKHVSAVEINTRRPQQIVLSRVPIKNSCTGNVCTLKSSLPKTDIRRWQWTELSAS